MLQVSKVLIPASGISKHTPVMLPDNWGGPKELNMHKKKVLNSVTSIRDILIAHTEEVSELQVIAGSSTVSLFYAT